MRAYILFWLGFLFAHRLQALLGNVMKSQALLPGQWSMELNQRPHQRVERHSDIMLHSVGVQ